jgi:hypothetical protein
MCQPGEVGVFKNLVQVDNCLNHRPRL